MRKVLFVLLLLVVGVVGLGFYREWFHFGTTSDPETGQPGFQLTVDQDKMKSDIQKAKQQVSPAKAQAEEK
jgi:hypothetical protein